MIRAAGVLFLTPDRLALFLKRGAGSDHPLEWSWPGGQAEDGEDAIQAAIRETAEESRREVDAADLTELTRSVAPPSRPATPAPVDLPPSDPGEDVDFTTFVTEVDAPFVPVLSDEHTGWAWASVDAPPEPLHPGARIALSRLTMNELGVARAMAAGLLASPQRYRNVTLWDIRITGVGVSYRTSIKEFVLRDSDVYLNDEFLARCNGLIAIMEHPPSATLNSKEFRKRVVGAVFLPYIKTLPDGAREVWAITKVYDDEANEAMASSQLSTSPSVVLSGKDDLKLRLEDGKHMLVEGDPDLLDHIAICPAGVWDKGGPPTGVSNAEMAHADAAPPELDTGKLDALGRSIIEFSLRARRLA